MFRPHWVCPRSRVCAFPIYTAHAPGCSIWSGPCVACGSSFRVLHKSMDSIGPAFCAFPGPSSSGSQDLDGCTPLRVQCTFSPPRSQPQFPCASCVCSWELASIRDLPGGCQPSSISGGLWLEIGGLFAVW